MFSYFSLESREQLQSYADRQREAKSEFAVKTEAPEMTGPAEAGPVCPDLALCQVCYLLCSDVTVFSKRSLCCAVNLFVNWRT